MADETTKQPTIPSKLVPIVWGEAGTTIFANHAAAQYDGKAVYLTFGQANPPVILGQTDEEKQQQLDKVQSLVVQPVIRLAMTVEDYRAVIEVLQKHIVLVDGIAKRGAK